jgi:hypothetical protein
MLDIDSALHREPQRRYRARFGSDAQPRARRHADAIAHRTQLGIGGAAGR